MKIGKKKEASISRSALEMSFFLLVLSQATAIPNGIIQSAFEYTGVFFLLCSLMSNRFNSSSHAHNINIWYALSIGAGLSVGLLLQPMSISIKLRALLPALVFWMIFTMSEGIIGSVRQLRRISYAIILAMILALILAVARGNNLFEGNGLGGRFYFGFNGGILYKNYYSSTVLAAFIGLYIALKYGQKPRVFDIALLIALTFFIFLASSNGTFLTMIAFLAILYTVEFVSKIKRTQRRVLVVGVCIIGLTLFLILFYSVALKNQNYLYRMQGLINYIAKFGSNKFCIFFGNGALAYAPGKSYVENIVSVTGWNGTLELSWLGILIKNGFIGVFAYIIVFARLLFRTFRFNKKVKALSFAIIVSLLISSLVETYIQNIHVIFGVYMFLLAFSCDRAISNKQSYMCVRVVNKNQED